MRITTLAIMLALPVSAQAYSDWSLSAFADSGASFTNHSDSADVTAGTHSPSPIAPDEQVILDKNKPMLQVGSFQLPSGFDLGMDLAWKNIGLGLGYRQMFPANLRHTQTTYDDISARMSYDGKASIAGLYIAPFVQFKQRNNSFLVASCKIGQASMDGDLINAYADDVYQYSENYHFTSNALFFEPSLRQGWFINKNFSLSIEVSYCFLQFSDVRLDAATDLQSHHSTAPNPSPCGIPFPGSPPCSPTVNVFDPVAQSASDKPSFGVDASSFFIKIRLDSFLFNAFLNPPPAPVLSVPMEENK